MTLPVWNRSETHFALDFLTVNNCICQIIKLSVAVVLFPLEELLLDGLAEGAKGQVSMTKCTLRNTLLSTAWLSYKWTQNRKQSEVTCFVFTSRCNRQWQNRLAKDSQQSVKGNNAEGSGGHWWRVGGWQSSYIRTVITGPSLSSGKPPEPWGHGLHELPSLL